MEAARAPKRLVDTATAAYAVGVAPATIRDWCRAHRLTRYGSRKRALWDLEQVYESTRRSGGTTV